MTTDAGQAKPMPRASRARRWLAMAAGSFGLLIAALAGIGAWYAGSGRITTDLVIPRIASALEDHLGGGKRVTLGGASVLREDSGALSITVRDLVVRDQTGRQIAAVPEAVVGLDGIQLTGRPAIRSIGIKDASLALRIDETGAIAFAAERLPTPLQAPDTATPHTTAPGSGPSSAAPEGGPVSEPGPRQVAAPSPSVPLQVVTAPELTPFRRLGAWLDLMETTGLDGEKLSAFGLSNGTLVIEDRRTGRTLVFAGVDIDLVAVSTGGARLSIAARGSGARWTSTTTISGRHGDGGRLIEMALKDLAPRDLMLASNHPDAFIAETPLSGVLRARLDGTGEPSEMVAELVAGAGLVGHRLDERLRLAVDGLGARVRWAAGNPALIVDELNVAAGANRIVLAGHVLPPEVAEGPVVIRIDAARATTTLLNPDEPAVDLEARGVALTLDPVARHLVIERAEIASGAAGALVANGRITFGGLTPGIELGLSTSRMPASAYYRLWPGAIATPVRAWLVKNMPRGTVEETTIAVRLAPGALAPSAPPFEASSFSLTGRVRGASLAVLPDALPLREADFEVRVDGRSARLNVARAVIEPSAGKRLAVSQGVFEIPDHRLRVPRSQTRFRIEGPADAAVELVNLDVFRGQTGGPALPTGNLRGQMSALVTIAMPIRETVAAREVDYRLEADFSGFGADRAAGDMKLENGTVRVVASSRDFLLTGEGRLGGSQASFEYRRSQPGAKPVIRLAATLDDAGRARLGLKLQGQITGPTPLKVVTEGEESGRYVVDADLTGAVVTDLIPGWTKPRGQAARARFVAMETDRGWRIDDLVVEGRGVLVRGTIELGETGEILSATLPAFHIADGDRVALRIDRQREAVRVAVTGQVMDARAILRSFSEQARNPGRGGPPRDMDIEMRVAAVAGPNGEVIRQLDLRASRRAGELRTMVATGRVGRDAPFAAEMRGQGAERRLNVSAGDGGALLRFLDIYTNMQGGRLSLTMTPMMPDGSIRSGAVEITNFAIRGDRAVAGMVAAADDGEPRRGRPANFDASSFSRLKADFTRNRSQISVRDGLLWGAAIGATVEGEFDLTADTVSISGTYVPAYALNNMFARIPVLGFFLGGAPDEGVIGITYRIQGRASAPRLVVNPLSAVTPGFLRKMFEFRGRSVVRDDDGATGTTPSR